MSVVEYQGVQPQPVPKKGGLCVPEHLLRYLDEIGADEAVKDLIRKRDAFGKAKYGQSLHTEDGRDDYQDALEENGDFLQYVMKLKLKGKDRRGLLPYIEIARGLCED